MARIVISLLLLSLVTACGAREVRDDEATLEIVAESTRQWTGVAVSPSGRVFVNYPRWSSEVPVSVAEIVNGEAIAFPNGAWNEWRDGRDPQTHFVCVQSVVFDRDGRLWTLDPANPNFAGVVPDGPKLVAFDLESRQPVQTISFEPPVIKRSSYLNDVRFDSRTNTAYLTDSGDGALIVLDLASGEARRLLDDHPSTQAEPIDIVIEGEAWKRGGQTPQVHADGIALTPDGEWIYFQALTGRTMYRVPTRALRNASLSAEALAAQVEKVAESGVSDGLLCDERGNVYLSSLEESAINKLTPSHQRERVVGDPRLAWPDSFAMGPDGFIYVTTALIHRGANPVDPYRVWRFKPE